MQNPTLTTSRTALTAITAAITLLLTQPVEAQVHPEKPTYKYENCYGVAKAGMNDCLTAANACAGTGGSDNSPAAWIYVPPGTCKKLTGGSLEPPPQAK
jgi:uncharacterized membrane protein